VLFYHIENVEALKERKKTVVVVGLLSALLESQAEDMWRVGILAIALTSQTRDTRDRDFMVRSQPMCHSMCQLI
jgi:hypothetical protein